VHKVIKGLKVLKVIQELQVRFKELKVNQEPLELKDLLDQQI
jgi:hypothetical protein